MSTLRTAQPGFDEHQLKVLDLLAGGMTLTQAACALNHSVQTVTHTVRRLVVRLGVKGDRAELIHTAYRLGILTPKPPVFRVPAVTPRCREVLQLLAAGDSYSDIARHFHISDETMRGHVEALRRALGARSRVELVSAAWSHKLLGPEA